MPFHLLLLVISFVLLLLAAIFEWPRTPPYAYSHTLGWLGIALFVLAVMMP